MLGPDPDTIDVVAFDKDGTLVDFHAMWGGWARGLGDRLDAAIRRPVSLDVFAAIGFDPTTGRVAPGGELATATMAGIEETVARVLRRWCPSIAAARRATAAAWSTPDPVALPFRLRISPRSSAGCARMGGASPSSRPTIARQPTRPCAHSACATTFARWSAVTTALQ